MAKSPKPWFLYMLRCADDSLYTGVTTDLPKRLAAHNAGRGAKYTRTRLPVALAYARRAGDRSAALRREYALKQKDRGEKLRMAAAWRRGRGRRARKP